MSRSLCMARGNLFSFQFQHLKICLFNSEKFPAWFSRRAPSDWTLWFEAMQTGNNRTVSITLLFDKVWNTSVLDLLRHPKLSLAWSREYKNDVLTEIATFLRLKWPLVHSQVEAFFPVSGFHVQKEYSNNWLEKPTVDRRTISWPETAWKLPFCTFSSPNRFWPFVKCRKSAAIRFCPSHCGQHLWQVAVKKARSGIRGGDAAWICLSKRETAVANQ